MNDPHSRALRRGRISEAGRCYLVTFCTYRRLATFADWGAACRVAAALCQPKALGENELLCWVLMPDHWHGLLHLGPGESLSRSVGRIKACGTRTWRTAGLPRAPLWGQGFHDRALRRDECLIDAARYVVANPVRAGLVRRAADYPFWDAVWLGKA